MGRTKACDEGAVVRAKRGRPAKHKKEEVVQRTGFDGPPVAPWRKTVPVIHQNVTAAVTGRKADMKKSIPEAITKKYAGKDATKPFPVMWAKALSGMKAYAPTVPADRLDLKHMEYTSDSLQTVGNCEPVCPTYDEVATAATVFHTVHNPLQPGVFGQSADKEKLKTNFMANCDPNQPMISKITVSSDDINGQERRVLDARKRLQEAMKHFG